MQEMKTFWTSILCLLLFSQNGFSQDVILSKRVTTCSIAKCLIPESGEKSDFDLPEWGENEKTSMISLASERIESTPPTTKWVKRKADRNCLSANPEDCLVWCLAEIPGTYKTVKGDWKKVNEASFLPEEESILEYLAEGYFVDWREVLFFKDLSLQAERQIIKKLKKKKYLAKNFPNTFNLEAENALMKFQLDHNLPIGNLNYETLDFLNIDF